MLIIFIFNRNEYLARPAHTHTRKSRYIPFECSCVWEIAVCEQGGEITINSLWTHTRDILRYTHCRTSRGYHHASDAPVPFWHGLPPSEWTRSTTCFSNLRCDAFRTELGATGTKTTPFKLLAIFMLLPLIAQWRRGDSRHSRVLLVTRASALDTCGGFLVHGRRVALDSRGLLAPWRCESPKTIRWVRACWGLTCPTLQTSWDYGVLGYQETTIRTTYKIVHAYIKTLKKGHG